MLRFLLIAICNLALLHNSYGQSDFYQKDDPITIGKKSNLFINGNYLTNANIGNDGMFIITGNLINEGSTGVFESQSGTVVLSGTADQEITSTSSWQFNKLILSKSSGDVTLNCNTQVDSLLTFNGGDLYIGSHQVDLGYTGNLSGENENSRIFATTGTVKAQKSISLPVGTDDIAGLGLYVHAPSEVFGMTTITRGHQIIAEAGAGSIARWFYVQPSISSPSESLDLRYFDSDGITDENRLQFYTKKSTSNLFFPKGGVANIITNQVNSTFFLNLEEELITLAPITDHSTCDPTNPAYVEAVFLIPTHVTEDDTVYFVNLSLPAPDSINSIWNSGDGFIFSSEDVIHPYADPGDYNASLSVSNAVCSDAYSEIVSVHKKSNRQSNSPIASDLISTFLFYPNPIEEELNWLIDFTALYESNLVLIDIFGRVVFQRQYHQKNIEDSQDFSALPSGLYLLKLEVMGRMYTYRIVKR